MTEETDTTDEASISDRTDAAETASASSTYKVLGELDADSGTGVLGKNTADSGTPIGVEGAVPNNATGYGLSTPHDARVSGTAELGGLAGPLTGGKQITDLLGDGLAVDSGALSAADARPNLGDGSTSVTNTAALTFGQGLTVSDDGDGTVTVSLDREYRLATLEDAEIDRDGQELGSGVALSADGSTFVLGAKNRYDGTEVTGAAYVGGTAPADRALTALFPSDGNSGSVIDPGYGDAVGVSSDGTVTAIGAPGQNNAVGAVYLYDLTDPDPQSTETKLKPFSSTSAFGADVAVDQDGTTMLIGAASRDPDGDDTSEGETFVYDISTLSSPTQTDVLSPSDADSGQFSGRAVDLTPDGSTAVVAAPPWDNDGTDEGAVYVYDLTDSDPQSTETKLVASDAADNDLFGRDVAIDDGGARLLVGAVGKDRGGGSKDDGKAYLYDLTASNPGSTETEILPSDGETDIEFGESVAISGDGKLGAVGAPEGGPGSEGSLYVYDLTATDPDAAANEELITTTTGFGGLLGGDQALALDDDGSTLLAGDTEIDVDGDGKVSGAGLLYYRV